MAKRNVIVTEAHKAVRVDENRNANARKLGTKHTTVVVYSTIQRLMVGCLIKSKIESVCCIHAQSNSETRNPVYFISACS